MIEFIQGFLLGAMTVAYISAIKKKFSSKESFSHTCRNCIHAIPRVDVLGKVELWCTICDAENSCYVNPDQYCGHFEYTEPIKTEIMKETAERMVKKSK